MTNFKNITDDFNRPRFVDADKIAFIQSYNKEEEPALIVYDREGKTLFDGLEKQWGTTTEKTAEALMDNAITVPLNAPGSRQQYGTLYFKDTAFNYLTTSKPRKDESNGNVLVNITLGLDGNGRYQSFGMTEDTLYSTLSRLTPIRGMLKTVMPEDGHGHFSKSDFSVINNDKIDWLIAGPDHVYIYFKNCSALNIRLPEEYEDTPDTQSRIAKLVRTVTQNTQRLTPIEGADRLCLIGPGCLQSFEYETADSGGQASLTLAFRDLQYPSRKETLYFKSNAGAIKAAQALQKRLNNSAPASSGTQAPTPP